MPQYFLYKLAFSVLYQSIITSYFFILSTKLVSFTCIMRSCSGPRRCHVFSRSLLHCLCSLMLMFCRSVFGNSGCFLFFSILDVLFCFLSPIWSSSFSLFPVGDFSPLSDSLVASSFSILFSL